MSEPREAAIDERISSADDTVLGTKREIRGVLPLVSLGTGASLDGPDL